MRGSPSRHRSSSRAVSAAATGVVFLAEQDAAGALDALHAAWAGFEELRVPYDAARVRVLAGLACLTVGDTDSASVEFDGARRTFEQLGARPDLARLHAVDRTPSEKISDLAAWELQVLQVLGMIVTVRVRTQPASRPDHRGPSRCAGRRPARRSTKAAFDGQRSLR